MPPSPKEACNIVLQKLGLDPSSHHLTPRNTCDIRTIDIGTKIGFSFSVLWGEQNGIRFHLYSNAKPKSNRVVGLWLVDQFTNSEWKTCVEESVFKAKNNTSQEGIVFERPFDVNWDDNQDPKWNDVKRFYDSFSKTLDQLNSNPEIFNEQHRGDVERYIQNITGGLVNHPNRTTSPATATFTNMSDEDTRRLLSCHQRLLFGAPGTGKSHQLNKEIEELFAKRYERVTFYPTYSYAQFVGCYKPTMETAKGAKSGDILSPKQLTEKLKIELDSFGKPAKAEADSSVGKMATILLFADKYYDSLEKIDKNVRATILKDAGAKTDFDRAYLNDEITATKIRRGLRSQEAEAETIAYKFVPGPFLRVLANALKNPAENFCLVIEEINRANAAAVFGDVFQLLDRATKDSEDGRVKEGESEYDIAASEDMKKFLKENGIATDKLRIPANMYIWATMNSADQGVFPIDTAFKRRWEFEYVGIDQGVTSECKTWTIDGTAFLWNDFRVSVNGLLSLHGVNEDKLMGPWFVKPEKETMVSAKQFQSKVLMYLWEDAARMCRKKVFQDDITTFSRLVSKWNGRVSSVFKCNEENKKFFEKYLADESHETPAQLAPMDGPSPEVNKPEGSGQ